MKFWIFICVLFDHPDRYRNSISDELYSSCRLSNGQCGTHYAGCGLWLTNSLYTCKWSIHVLYYGLYPYCKRFILRILHVTKRVTMMCWSCYFYSYDGYCFYGLRSTMRTNEFPRWRKIASNDIISSSRRNLSIGYNCCVLVLRALPCADKGKDSAFLAQTGGQEGLAWPHLPRVKKCKDFYGINISQRFLRYTNHGT